MTKRSTRQWDYLAIAAIVLAVAGFAVYALPAGTGDVYGASSWRGVGGCEPGDIVLESEEFDSSLDDEGVLLIEFVCEKGQAFNPDRLPLAGVFGAAALLLLVLRLRPVTTRQNR